VINHSFLLRVISLSVVSVGCGMLIATTG